MPAFQSWTSALHADTTIAASTWERGACLEVNAGCIKCGNHSCMPRTCRKGKLGKAGFCRMRYFHWRAVKKACGKQVIRRVHGRALQKRWDGKGLPPVYSTPPQRGAPGLERNHPYHFKMNPGILMRPKCNHDTGIMAKLPVLTPEQIAAVTAEAEAQTCVDSCPSGPTTTGAAPSAMPSCGPGDGAASATDGAGDRQADVEKEIRAAIEQSIASIIREIIDCEYYTSDYTTKNQPHANNLLQTLHDSIGRYRQYAAERQAAGKSDLGLEGAQRLMQSLASATNRRMHVGLPTIYAYLLGKPNQYCSHLFEGWSFHKQWRAFAGCLERGWIQQRPLAANISPPLICST